MYGTIQRFLLFGDYDEEVYATGGDLEIMQVSPTNFFNFFFFFFFFFPTGLVQLNIAGLPLRSCQTIGAPSVQGSAQCPFFVSGSCRI